MNKENHYINLAKIGYLSFRNNILHRRDYVGIILKYCRENELEPSLFLTTNYRESDKIDQEIISRMMKLYHGKIEFIKGPNNDQYWVRVK